MEAGSCLSRLTSIYRGWQPFMEANSPLFFEPNYIYQSLLKAGSHLSLLAVIYPGCQPFILAGSHISGLAINYQPSSYLSGLAAIYVLRPTPIYQGWHLYIKAGTYLSKLTANYQGWHLFIRMGSFLKWLTAIYQC